MSKLRDDLDSDVRTVITTLWDTRKGRTVPSTTDVVLPGGAVELDATFLYADMADSSKMAKELDRRVAAKILKAFLATSTRLIRHCGGSIASFDGDRVMGIFIGHSKNSSAAKCALQIDYVVQEIIKPKFTSKYDPVRNASFSIGHGTGIDTGTVLAVCAGARNHNDLIWIGRAPNLAAKLSDLRKYPYSIWITASVYNDLDKGLKYDGDGKDIWEARTWTFLDENIRVYRSNYHLKP
jgi:adenylate cyclase